MSLNQNNQLKKTTLAALALSMPWLATPVQAVPFSTLNGQVECSYIPPETVLINPQPTLAMQAANRAPGNAMLPEASSSVMSPQQARQALLNALMGQSTLQQFQSSNYYRNLTAPATPAPFNQEALGQAPVLVNPDGSVQLGAVQPGVSQAQNNNQNNNVIASQTLTGNVNQPPLVRQDIRRRGYSNGLSGIMSFGSTLLTGRHATGLPATPMGLGMFGLTGTGFGVRNGFRL